MKQRPEANELERLAAGILRNQPLPDDAKARSYEQRMAAKALSIARYDVEHGAADEAEELALFRALYGGDGAALASLNRRLAAEIRAGKWDEAPPALWALLMAQTRARLRRVNPRYLESREDAG